MRWAPITTTVAHPVQRRRRGIGLAARTARRRSRRPRRRTRAPRNVTPNGMPSARAPAGTAAAHRSSRLVPLVKRPSAVLTPTGSAATAASVGAVPTVGSATTSTASQRAEKRAAQLLQPFDVGQRARRRGGRARRATIVGDRRVGAVGMRGEELAEGVPARRRRTRPRRAARRRRDTARGRSRDGPEPRRAGRAPRATPSRGRRRRARRGRRRAGRRRAAVPGSTTGVPIGGRAAPRVVGVEAGHEVERGRRLADRPGEHRDAVEAGDRGHDARECCTSPRVGLSPTMPHNAAGTRPDPAVSVPSAEVGRADGDRDGRARARPAGDVVGRVRVAARAERRARADEAGRELVEVGLADDDRARVDERLHRGRARRRVDERTPGWPAVVGMPATSMLSFTATVQPESGSSPVESRAARARRRRRRRGVIHAPSSRRASAAASAASARARRRRSLERHQG